MWALLLLGVGLSSAETPRGRIALRTSPGARLVVFPRVDAKRIEIGIYNNRVPLADQMADVSLRWLQDGYATGIGGGAWFVTLHLEREDLELQWEESPSRITLRLAPGAPEVVPPPVTPSLEDLLSREPPPRRQAPPPPLVLHPLQGDAGTLYMAPLEALDGRPEVLAPEVSTDQRGLYAIDAYRHQGSTERGITEPDAVAMIGVEYGRLGWWREASYYLERSIAMGRDDAGVALEAAAARLALGEAEEARANCRYASSRGASEEQVLACLGGASRLDAVPAPSDVGMALQATTSDPHLLLLAAQLLQMDHRHRAALKVLERVQEQRSPAHWASLGDAYLSTGDLAAAKEAWDHAAVAPELASRMSLRMNMAGLLERGPDGFAQAIPYLLHEAGREEPWAIEANYLLAQIAVVYGDADLAAEQLAFAWDREAARTVSSDIPERLVQVCEERLRQLALEERHVDQVSFFNVCWRREMDDLVSDPDTLEATSHALLALGLYDDALSMQLRAMVLYTRMDQEDPQALIDLASLYVRTGRATEALETIHYAEQQPGAKELRRERGFVEGEAHEALGHVEEALTSWALVGTDEAKRRRGLLLANEERCREALPLLKAKEDDEQRLAALRCLLKLGREGEVPALADQETTDELAGRDAGWLDSVAAFRSGDSQEQAEGIWKELLEEEATDKAWQDKLNARE